MNISSSMTPGMTMKQVKENLSAHYEAQKSTFEPSRETRRLIDSLDISKEDFLVDAYVEAKKNSQKRKFLGMEPEYVKILGVAAGTSVTALAAANSVQNLMGGGGGIGVPLTLMGLVGLGVAGACFATRKDAADTAKYDTLVNRQKQIFEIASNPMRKEDTEAAKVTRKQLFLGLRSKEANSTALFQQAKFQNYAEDLEKIPGGTAADILPQLPDYRWDRYNLQGEIRDIVLGRTTDNPGVLAREISTEHAIEQLKEHQKGAHANLEADSAAEAGRLIEALSSHPGKNLMQAYKECDERVDNYDRTKFARYIQSGLLATAGGIGALVAGNYLGLGAAAAVTLGGVALAGQRILSHKEPESLGAMRTLASNRSSVLDWLKSPAKAEDGKAESVERDELFTFLRERMMNGTPRQMADRRETELELKKVIGDNALEMWESALKNGNREAKRLLENLMEELRPS